MYNQIKSHIEFVKISINLLKKIKSKYENIYSFPLNYHKFELNDDLRIELDSVAYRFSKIQSILGEKLFREILEALGLNTDKNFIEILNMLVKNNIIDEEDIKTWLSLRKIRNELSHKYPDEFEEIIDAVNEIFEILTFFVKIITNIENTLKGIENANA